MDEVHERSSENDLMLAQLLLLAPPDMKLVLMSAHVALRPLQEYFSRHGAGGHADELRQVGAHSVLAPVLALGGAGLGLHGGVQVPLLPPGLCKCARQA
jgi:hypothetical protein